MRKKRIVAALGLALAVTGSSAGFVSPAPSQALAPATGTALALPATLEPAVASPVGIAAKKVNLKKVTTNNLNRRKGKSTKTKVLLTIPRKN